MTVKEIRMIAKNMNINPGKMKKAELIKTIQIQENNTPCFQTAAGACNQTGCCWRSDCLM
jgi:hypothetical protein